VGYRAKKFPKKMHGEKGSIWLMDSEGWGGSRKLKNEGGVFTRCGFLIKLQIEIAGIGPEGGNK